MIVCIGAESGANGSKNPIQMDHGIRCKWIMDSDFKWIMDSDFKWIMDSDFKWIKNIH
jgi:hypothetical protein